MKVYTREQFWLYTALGVFSYWLLSLQPEFIQRIAVRPLGLAGICLTVGLYHVFGICISLITSVFYKNYSRYSSNYKIFTAHYALVALLLFSVNCLLFCLMKLLIGIAHPWVIRREGFWLICVIVFIELIVVGLTLFIHALRHTNRLNEEKKQLEHAGMQAQYTALQQQLNPHFLFNSLNTLIAEIAYDPATAISFAQHLSDVYRYVLDCQKLRIVSLGREVDFMHAYLYLHQVRLGACLSFEEEGFERISDYSLPPLTLQILVENVIKHNVIRETMPLKIHFSLLEGNGAMWLEVRHKWQPKKDRVSGAGCGLNNLSERYALLGFPRPRITSVPGGDFIVMVYLSGNQESVENIS